MVLAVLAVFDLRRGGRGDLQISRWVDQAEGDVEIRLRVYLVLSEIARVMDHPPLARQVRGQIWEPIDQVSLAAGVAEDHRPGRVGWRRDGI